MKIKVCIETEIEIDEEALRRSNSSFSSGFDDVLKKGGERFPENPAYMAGCVACVTAIYNRGRFDRYLRLKGDSLEQGIRDLRLALARKQ